ncbi:unnamed protein product [Ixodes pacificus]
MDPDVTVFTTAAVAVKETKTGKTLARQTYTDISGPVSTRVLRIHRQSSCSGESSNDSWHLEGELHYLYCDFSELQRKQEMSDSPFGHQSHFKLQPAWCGLCEKGSF